MFHFRGIRCRVAAALDSDRQPHLYLTLNPSNGEQTDFYATRKTPLSPVARSETLAFAVTGAHQRVFGTAAAVKKHT